jgi:uncharacterized protein
MSLSMYDASLPVFVRAFENLGKILEKGEQFAREQGIDPKELVETRLVADMDPLRSQIQRASDSAKGAAARLGGVDNPSFPDNETTFEELHERISKTVDFLNGVDRSQIEGSEDREVTINSRRQAVTMRGQDYLLRFALPNFFFHVTTAYDILRHKGVPVGKMDYIGDL